MRPRPNPEVKDRTSRRRLQLPAVVIETGGRSAPGVSVIGSAAGFDWHGGTCPADHVLILHGPGSIRAPGLFSVTVRPSALAVLGAPSARNGTLPRVDAALLLDYVSALRSEELDIVLAALASDHVVQMVADLLRKMPAPDALDRALALLAGDPRLTAPMLASQLGLSLRQLRRAATRRGQSLSDEITRIRLVHAHARLTGPPDAARIASIVFDAGFADLGTFNRQFRKRYGVTPRAVRGR